MKITYNGRSVNGTFYSFKVWVGRTFGKAIMVTLLGLALYGLGSIFFSSNVITYAAQEVREVDMTPAKIEELKDDLVARLAKCESAGHTEDDGIIMYDNNQRGSLKGKNVWSIGPLQWKQATVQHYVKLRDGKSITPKDAIILSLDLEEASALAKYTIFEQDGWKNWLNCGTKLGLAAEISIIKKLER